MFKFLSGLSSLLVTSLIWGQQNPRLVIRSDDMGSFHSANMACIDTYRNGITTAIEVMVVTPWFPEAVKLLRENPGVDAGIHLTITSEWENMKWRPLTQCPSLTDGNGYFYPMIFPNPAYPGQSVTANKWNLKEIEQEFRAQIELGLKNIPQASHFTGHMGSLRFDTEVSDMVHRLSEEYGLSFVESDELQEKYNAVPVTYEGSNKTAQDKITGFIRMLDKLEAGKNYIFVDHPAFNGDEMETVGHIGYDWVAEDRQGVTGLLKSDEVKRAIREKGVELINYSELTKSLPRTQSPAKEGINAKGIANYLDAVKKTGQDLHSLMIVRHGKVVFEQWFGDNAAGKLHVLNSVSKTYTAMATGFAVAENRIKVTDKVISFFPGKLPEKIDPYLSELEIRHLLTMSVGHDATELNKVRRTEGVDWVEAFLAAPMLQKPGSEFEYNSLATYMLSAIIQEVTGMKLLDYLYPRLFRPLGITGVTWEESPQGINAGGWGLYVKTEDMAKLGQLILQKGMWNDKQLIPEFWIREMTTSHIASLPAGVKRADLKIKPEDSDWLQGYGYQMWRCRHNAVRADGAAGQYIIILPEKDAVIAVTANIPDMQAEINLIWKYLLPAIK
ncbi:MAG: ChbG/HpnK family deacetylase [Tannerella sp.]|nr:ChbG/HpnK family deacetylase [Tannerella sp.]